MNGTRGNHVSKLEFRLVALGLSIVIVGASAFVVREIGEAYQLHVAGPIRSTTILVRGGSMSAYTLNSSSGAPLVWRPPLNPASLEDEYCVAVSTSDKFAMQFGEEGDPRTGYGFLPAVDLVGNWEVDIKGKNGDADGLRFTPRTGPCNGIAGNNWIVVGTTSSWSGFYAYPVPASQYHNDSRRFEYYGAACPHEDEEVCERMDEVDIMNNGHLVQRWPCKDGDCLVIIGTTQVISGQAN